ncbi:MAG: LysE family transporter [Luminiphilus sp.]|nr:LysE family transporter [Luminiphilus sp.]
MMLPAYATGFALGFSLILAIGAQNAFVLRQGLLRQHVLLVVLFCASADTLLILAGVAGLSALIADAVGQYASVLYGLAALWLAGYGVMRLSSAIRASDAMSTNVTTVNTGRAVLTTAAILTLGNPHVYLDTVVLIGAVSLQFNGMSKLAYGAGAITASFVFFFMLGYGASLLAPTMQRPNAWRILDTLIALVMFVLALGMAKAGGWLGG